MARSGSSPRDAHRASNPASSGTSRAATPSAVPSTSPAPDASAASWATAFVGNDVLAGAAAGADLGALGAFVGGELALGAAGVGAEASGPSLTSMREVLRRADSGVPDEDLDEAMQLARSSAGQQLPSQHRARLEAAFDHGFDHVRVHVGGNAARASSLLRAHAFALGSDVFFNSGTWAPGTPGGDRLLAHELTHVVQHDERRLPAGGGVSHPSDPHEVEAYANESRIVRRLAQVDRLPADLVGEIAGAALDAPLPASAHETETETRADAPVDAAAELAPADAAVDVAAPVVDVAVSAPAAVAPVDFGLSSAFEVGAPAMGGGSDGAGDVAIGGLSLRRADGPALPPAVADHVSSRLADAPATEQQPGADAGELSALFEAADALAALDGGMPTPDAEALLADLGGDLRTRAALATALAAQLGARLGLSSTPPVFLDAHAAELTASLGVAGVYHNGAIYLDPVAFDPGALDARVTLAHELVHAAQDRLPHVQGATIGLAEHEAHTLADDLAGGAAVDAPVVALPGNAVATEGDAFDLSGVWAELKAKFEGLNEEQAGKAEGLKKDPKDLTKTKENKGDAVKKWRKGLKATADELEDSDAGEALWDKINDEEPYSGALAKVKSTQQWADLVDMYKSTLENDEEGPSQRAEWERLFADKGWRDATKKMWRILAADAKKEAKLSAEEELAATQAEEAKVKEAPPEAAREEVPEGEKGAGGDAKDAGKFGGFTGLLADIDVPAAPPATPEWEKATSADGTRPGYDRVAKTLADYNTTRDQASQTQSGSGSRIWDVTTGLVSSGVGGFIDGMKDGAVDKLKEKLVFDHVDGFLNKTIGARAGLGNVDFVSKGLAIYDMATGDPLGDVQKNYTKVGESWGKTGAYFTADAWAHCDSTLDYVGVFFAGLADLAQAICDTLKFVEDLLSKISTILWAVGLALIIVGFCTLWLGWGAGLITAGKNVISIARFLDKIVKVISAIAKPVKAFGMFANVLASYLVPEELFVERFGKAQEGVTEFTKDAGDVIGGSTVEHAHDSYQAKKKKKEAEKAEGGAPASEAEKEKGKAEAEQVMGDAKKKLDETSKELEELKANTEKAKKEKKQADDDEKKAADPKKQPEAEAEKPKAYKDRLKEGFKEKYGHFEALNVFTKKGRAKTMDDMKKSMNDIGASWQVLKMELGSSSTTNFRELKQVSDASIKSGEDVIKKYDMFIEDATADLKKAKEDLKKVPSDDPEAQKKAEDQLAAAKSKLEDLEQTRRQHDITVAELKSFSKAIATSPVAFDQIAEADRADAEKKATAEVGKNQEKLTEIDKQIAANQQEIKRLENNSKGKSKKTRKVKDNTARIQELKAENNRLGDEKKTTQEALAGSQKTADSYATSGGSYKGGGDGIPGLSAYTDWAKDMKARYAATSTNDAHKSPMSGSSKKLWSILGSGVTILAGTPPEAGTDEQGLEEKKQKAGNTRPFDAILGEWDNAGKNVTTVMNGWFGNADLNIVVMNEAPIKDMSELDTKYAEAETNIKQYLNHYEIAYEASVTEKQIAAEVKVKEELDASAGETVDKGLNEMKSPLQKGKADATARAGLIAGADTGTKEADPEAAAKTKEASKEMSANKEHMSGGSSGGDTSDAAGSSNDAQDEANKASTEGKEKGSEVSNDQVGLLDTLNTGRDSLSTTTTTVREELKAKTEEEKGTLESVKAEKAEHLALAIDHHNKGESAAGEYNKKLSTAVDWADKYKAAREGWAAGLGG
jgi:hypothetical protein